MEQPAPGLREPNPASKEYLEDMYELEHESPRVLQQARIGNGSGLRPRPSPRRRRV